MTIELRLTATIDNDDPTFKGFLEDQEIDLHSIDLQNVDPYRVLLMINEFGEAQSGSITILGKKD